MSHCQSSAERTQLRVLALPAFARRQSNPFQALLYDEVGKLRVEVRDWTYLSALWRPADIWHFHHPDTVVFPRALWQSLGETVYMRLLMLWAKLRRIKIIWTVHDLDSSDGLHPRLEAWFWRYFLAHVDGCIYLTRAGEALAKARFARLNDIPAYLVPHGGFAPAYANTISRADARARLNLPQKASVLLHFGLIRPYKNVPELIEAFNALPQAGPDEPPRILLIAGRVVDRDLAERLRALAAHNPNVRLMLEWIPFDDTQLYFNASNLVVLPYRRILNSGTLLLAMSFKRPVLVPDKGVLAEQQEKFGSDWVRLYTGALQAEDLIDACAWATSERRSDPTFAGMQWRDVAAMTRAAYDDVLGDNAKPRAATPFSAQA